MIPNWKLRKLEAGENLANIDRPAGPGRPVSAVEQYCERWSPKGAIVRDAPMRPIGRVMEAAIPEEARNFDGIGSMEILRAWLARRLQVQGKRLILLIAESARERKG
jgi:hypothetical protein